MLKLTNNDITLEKSADNKIDAIKSIAQQLTNNGLVAEQYVQGMLNREAQNSTFLGNGIAIPHGTVDTRDLVLKTGVAVHHFPEGVEWGDGHIAYVAIGIAAKSDEHLSILKQLTKVLSADGVEAKLKSAKNKQDIIQLLNGDVQFEADFNSELIHLNFPAEDMLQMVAVGAGLLKNGHLVGNPCVAELITKQATHLGEGVWLTSSNVAVNRTAMSIVTTNNTFLNDDVAVKALITLAVCNDTHQGFLKTITNLIVEQNQAKLLTASKQQLVEMFDANNAETIQQEVGDSAIFKINNTHGLHARPSAMLVSVAKQFKSSIKVSVVAEEAKFVNAKSLMKVVGLGVKHGDSLKFIVEGEDSQAALESIGEAIASGLSEG